MTQKMADLPEQRVTPAPPFSRVSINYFGPITVTVSKRTTDKRWGCIFVCMVTRAVHLEVATGLSTPEFLSCFRNFCNIRGQPNYVYSDNGTNFEKEWP